MYVVIFALGRDANVKNKKDRRKGRMKGLGIVFGLKFVTMALVLFV